MKYILRLLYLFWLPLLFLSCMFFTISVVVIAFIHLVLWVVWIPISWVLYGGFCNADQFLLNYSFGFLLDGPGILIDIDEKFRKKCL